MTGAGTGKARPGSGRPGALPPAPQAPVPRALTGAGESARSSGPSRARVTDRARPRCPGARRPTRERQPSPGRFKRLPGRPAPFLISAPPIAVGAHPGPALPGLERTMAGGRSGEGAENATGR